MKVVLLSYQDDFCSFVRSFPNEHAHAVVRKVVKILKILIEFNVINKKQSRKKTKHTKTTTKIFIIIIRLKRTFSQHLNESKKKFLNSIVIKKINFHFFLYSSLIINLILAFKHFIRLRIVSIVNIKKNREIFLF